MRAPGKKTERSVKPAVLYARLSPHVTLETEADGDIVARFESFATSSGKFSTRTADRAQDLFSGLPLNALSNGRRDSELGLLIRRLAAHGLLEYRLGRSRSDDGPVIIEPQARDYWPRMPQLGTTGALVLSRFAYMRRRGSEMVLESPLSGALFRIRDPKIAAVLASLVTPLPVKTLRRRYVSLVIALFALLVDCQILFKVKRAGDQGLRTAEGNDSLVLWDFHDLVFHARSTEGRHANPSGGHYPYAGVVSPLPAVRPSWPGKKIDLRKFLGANSQTISPTAKVLRDRHSTRSFDDRHPITLAELSKFLDRTARVRSEGSERLDRRAEGESIPLTSTVRPYPGAGGSYELELYLAVDKCEGLARGFYHYDAGRHALVPIHVRTPQLAALLNAAQSAMDAPANPQILITMAARFGRMSWKYSSVAYALVLKDVGVLTQTFYIAATDMGLGGCAVGTMNIDLFAKMTGIDFYVEGPVGQFALGAVRDETPGSGPG